MKITGQYGKSLLIGSESILVKPNQTIIPFEAISKVRLNKWATCEYTDVEIWSESRRIAKLTLGSFLEAYRASKALEEVMPERQLALPAAS
jgi:hypothetical protein